MPILAVTAAGPARIEDGCVLVYEQIEAMVAVLRDSPRVTELEVRSGDTSVRLRRPAPPRGKKSERAARGKAVGQAVISASGQTSVATGRMALQSGPKIDIVTAHLVGVFRPTRNAPISAGDTVEAGQVLGQIEAMRLMNDVTAPSDGIVSNTFVQEGQPVEYGQALFELSPVEEVSG